jgi:hypothetical protein
MLGEAWRQKLAGKGRETGSQTDASKQAGRGRWAPEAGKQKQAGRQAGRQTEAGKDRYSQGKVGRQASRDRHSEAGRMRQAGRLASRWADAGMKKEACMQAIIDSDTQAGMDEKW